MKFHGQPVLKYRTKDRLHIGKEPGLLAWISLFSIVLIAILLDYYLIPDYYFALHAGFLTMCLIFSLNFMKTWDLIMDREENLGTMISRNWYHIFSIRVPEENVQRFPLSTISGVIVTSDRSIDLKRRNEKSIQIISESNNHRLLSKLREEISVFLCLERVENLKDSNKIFYNWDSDSLNAYSPVAEGQESDSEIQEEEEEEERESPAHSESQFQYGSNIKIITGVL